LELGSNTGSRIAAHVYDAGTLQLRAKRGTNSPNSAQFLSGQENNRKSDS
jgi:hypothetical protein